MGGFKIRGDTYPKRKVLEKELKVKKQRLKEKTNYYCVAVACKIEQQQFSSLRVGVSVGFIYLWLRLTRH